jgi:WD40 repeat protein
VADAIHYAHEAGIVHRDVKPSNILLDDELRPYVTDFGLAKRDAAEITVSTSGKVVGTPAYMSPEQAAGSEGVDGRSDVYSLGVILYELLTGELPFHGTAYSLIQRVIHDEPPHPQQLNSSIPRDLSTICLEAMARVPAHRYATAHELAEDLQRYLRGESVLARPPHVWERGWRWVRRRPALAGLWTAVCVAVLAIGGACAGLFYGRSLRASLDETEQQRRAAQVAQRHAEQFQYQRHISVSHSRITNGNMYGVDDLLDSCDPKSRNWEWRYLKRLGHDELRSFQGHDVFAVCIAIHPSGLKIAVGGCPEGTVKIWDLVTGRLLRILNGHTKDLWSVEYSPDGTHFASGGMDNTVRLWDGATGEPRHTLTHSGGVTCLAFSPDSRLVVSGSGDQTVKIWDAESGALFRELHGHVGRSVETSGVVGVSFSPDGKFLAAASRDQTVKIYEVSTSQELHTLREHTDRANSVAELSHAVAFSPDGSIVATSCHNAIRIWDWKAGKLLKTWPGHEGQIKALVFSSDSQLLASGGADQGLRLWNVTTGTEIACLRGHTSDIWSIAFHPNGRELYSSSGSENLIRVWDIQRALQSTMERRHDGPVYDVAFSPDGPFFASAGSRGEVRIWTLDSPQHIHELHCHDSEVRALAFSRDGRWLVTAGADRKAKVWNVTDWSAVSCHDEHTNEVRAIAVAPSVDRIASMSLAKADGIHIWNPLTGQTCVTLPSWLPWDTDISFSPDGRLLAAPNETDGRTGITLWDTMTARPRFRLPHDLGPWSITFSPNARMIATAGGEYSIKLWDTASGQLLRTLLGHSAAIYDLAFSPDGTRLASASLDQTVRLWDNSSGGELLTLRGHDRIVYAVQFSPDGHWLVSAGGDGRILLWDARPMLESKPTQ